MSNYVLAKVTCIACKRVMYTAVRGELSNKTSEISIESRSRYIRFVTGY